MTRPTDLWKDCDFSHANHAYFLQARDLARRDPSNAAILLGLPNAVIQEFARMNPQGLMLLSNFGPPLLAPRWTRWWLNRLVHALANADRDEIRVVIDHAGLLADD